MLDTICYLLWLTLYYGFLVIMVPYYLYTRVVDVALCYRHYTTQKYEVAIIPRTLPIFGNYFTLLNNLR